MVKCIRLFVSCLVQLARRRKAKGREKEGSSRGRSLSATIAGEFWLHILTCGVAFGESFVYCWLFIWWLQGVDKHSSLNVVITNSVASPLPSYVVPHSCGMAWEEKSKHICLRKPYLPDNQSFNRGWAFKKRFTLCGNQSSVKCLTTCPQVTTAFIPLAFSLEVLPTVNFLETGLVSELSDQRA